MPIFGSQPRSIFLDSVPPEVVEAIGRLILERYPIAFDKAEEQYSGPELHDVLPHLRRAEIETTLPILTGRFPGSLRVEAVRNVTGNANHRELFTDRVVITQSKVEAERGPIRKAEHRKTLAVASQLTWDWFGDEPPTPDPTARLWACFVHMPDKQLIHPSMVRIAFPLADGSWEDSIDFYDLIPSLRGFSQSEELFRLREELRRQRRAG